MGVKSFARRIRGMLRRKKRTLRDKGKGRETQSDDHNSPEDKPSPEGPVIDHRGYAAAQNSSRQRRIISRAEIQSARQSQEASIFFSKFPLEIRRLIYRQVFANYLKPRRVTPSSPGSDLRLHIYRGDTGQWKLGHTHCKIHPGEPDQEDALATSTLPFGAFTRNDFVPPKWFWFAWVMRLNWGRHWKCQHAIQKRWDPRTGLCKEVAPAPFLPLFLTCKSVYDEAITLFFEEVTPIFTSSEDAHRFFIQKPHPYLSSLRTVEFSFCNPNDHLYLSKVWRESLQKIVEEEAADYHAEHGDNDGPPPMSLVPNPAVSDKVGTTSCGVETFPIFWEKVNVFGKQLWAELLRGVRTSTALKDLDITISGRITQRAILAPFGGHEAPALSVEEEAEHEENEEEEREGEEVQQSVAHSSVYEIGDDIWQLRGTLAVSFSQDNERFVQRGSKMIRLLPGGQQVEVDGEET